MSKSSVQQVIQKAVSDAAFRRQLQREPAVALSGFDLTADERASITTGDPTRLTALGVDQRMSKAFALGAAADASTPVNSTAIDNPGTAGTAAFIDEGSVAGSNSPEGLVGDTTSGATSVFASDPTSGATSSMIGSDGAQLDAGIVGDATSGASSVFAADPTSHLQMIEQDLDTGASVNASVASSSAPSHLQMIEQDLDTGSAFESTATDAAAPTHLQMIEQDLDTGVTDVSADVQISGDAQITE
jgi:hypothetical protein